MQNLLADTFKINLSVHFSSTDIDHNEIVEKIRSTNLFHIKHKSSKEFDYHESLKDIMNTTIFKNEIFTFKCLKINIVETGESTRTEKSYLSVNQTDNTLEYKIFETDEYKDVLSSLHKKSTEVKNTRLSFLKSFILDDYLDEKNKADTLFLLKKYNEANKIYSQYSQHNDFSHYCIEMSCYCKIMLKKDISVCRDNNFIDSFYYRRLVYMLYLSGEYTHVAYKIYKHTKYMNTDFLYRIGLRLLNNSKFHRKGVSLVYLHKKDTSEIVEKEYTEDYIIKRLNHTNEYILESKETLRVSNKRQEVLSGEVYNIPSKYSQDILLKALDNTKNAIPFDRCQVLNKEYTNKLEILDFQGNPFPLTHDLYQYQVSCISFQCHLKGYFIFNKKVRVLDEVNKLNIKFNKVGTHTRDLFLISDKIYHYTIKYIVKPRFTLSCEVDYRLSKLMYIDMNILSDFQCVKISSKNKFSVANKCVKDIIKEDILGISELCVDDYTSIDDKIVSDVYYKEYTRGKYNKYTSSDKRNKLQLSRKKDTVVYMKIITHDNSDKLIEGRQSGSIPFHKDNSMIDKRMETLNIHRDAKMRMCKQDTWEYKEFSSRMEYYKINLGRVKINKSYQVYVLVTCTQNKERRCVVVNNYTKKVYSLILVDAYDPEYNEGRLIKEYSLEGKTSNLILLDGKGSLLDIKIINEEGEYLEYHLEDEIHLSDPVTSL